MAYTRTHKYLYPGVAYGYDDKFLKFLRDIDKLVINSFIGDMDYEKIVESCLFLLIQKSQDFAYHQKFFQIHKSYIDDYQSNKLHMFVLKVPDEKTYNWFVLSRYSKMYNQRFLNLVFRKSDNTYTGQYHILAKTEQKWLELKEQYNLSDNLDIPEYDSCIKMSEEVYNFEITKT